MLPTIISVPPIPFCFLWASLRDRAALPSPLRGLVPSGGHPSPLRPLRGLRAPLTRWLAALTAVCLADSPVPGVGTVAIPPPESISLALHAKLVSGCAAALRLASPAFADANAAWLTSPVVPSAQAPRRLHFGSVSGTSSPVLRYPGPGLSHSLRCSAFTPDAARCPELEAPVFVAVSEAFADTSRHKYAGTSVCSLNTRLSQLSVAA